MLWCQDRYLTLDQFLIRSSPLRPIFTQPIITQFHKSLCQSLIYFTSKVLIHMWFLRSGMAHITSMCIIPFFKNKFGKCRRRDFRPGWMQFKFMSLFWKIYFSYHQLQYIYIYISILCSNEHYIQIRCIFCANNMLRVQRIFIANPSELKYYFKVCAESF